MAEDGALDVAQRGSAPPDGRAAFHVAMQQSRLAVWTIAGLIAAASRFVGVLDLGYGAIVAYIAVVHATTLLFLAAYRSGLDRRLGLDPAPLWMGADVLFITGSVYLSGGAESPWYVAYLSNAAAAAFVGGERAALAVGAVNSLAYLSLLALMGQIGAFDRAFWLAASHIGFLYGAAFFFLRGVSRLQESRRLVRRLQREQAQKVEQLIAMNTDLDQGTRALAEANMEIREADRMKSQFLANMSHELRTPLNSIIGFSEILQERLEGQIQPRYARFLSNIHASGQHLLAIINDILDLSKVEAGKMEVHPERLEPRAVIEGVLNVMHGIASKAEIRFDLDAPDSLPEIETDPAKFKQILYNLLSNAVKFSPPGAAVRITARGLGAGESPLGVEALRLGVADRGIGIAPADQEVIFHEFRQADGSSSRSFGGTGLGLAIVKRFVELLGGDIDLESELGAGSTFSVTLPLRPRGRPGEAPASAVRGAPGEHRVLVVEDDLLAFQSLSRLLGSAGYFPVRARHGEEALALARSLRPTCVTLDLALPGLSGLEVLKELKRDPATKEIPVVIVSLSDNRELGLALGADDYFTKPVDRQRLAARLAEIAPLPRPPASSRILVVDDDPQVHDLLDAALGPLGYALDHAGSGAEGIERALAAPPDLLVLDLVMPDITGFEVAAALGEHAATAAVPIVILTAKDLTDADRARLGGRIAALVHKGGGTPARLVDAIRGLERRSAREGADAR